MGIVINGGRKGLSFVQLTEAGIGDGEKRAALGIIGIAEAVFGVAEDHHFSGAESEAVDGIDLSAL